MQCWQVVGFAKSFLAVNLAAQLAHQGQPTLICTDPEHPYATWNKAGQVGVVERSTDVDGRTVSWLILDGTAHDFEPHGYIYGYTPDAVRADQARAFRQRSSKPTLLALIGYASAYGDVFESDVMIPWDARQTSSILMGVPLASRDPKIRTIFATLVDRMKGVI